MPSTIIKMKHGALSSIDNTTAGLQSVPFESGAVYFATDGTGVGKIWFDDPTTSKRIDMTHYASVLNEARAIDGVQFDGSNAIIHFGISATTANVQTKSVDCQGFTLAQGARIMVKYTATNTANNPKLDVNSTGAKNIYYHNAPIGKEFLKANEVHEYVYDGTNWIYVGTLAINIGITVDSSNSTLYITSPIDNGDGVSY